MSQSQGESGRLRDRAGELLSATPLALLVMLSGLTISLYAVFVHQFTKRGTEEDAVKKAALYAVSTIDKVSVDDAVFGRVGLCDWPAQTSKSAPITSLNSIYATLRLDHQIAQRLHLPFMDQLILADINRAHQIESRLRQALSAACINQSGQSSGQRTMYGSARASIDQMLGRGHLSELKISLGTTAPALFDSGIKAPAKTDSQYVINGHYRAGVNVPLTDREFAPFYQLASSSQLCSERFFQEATTSMTPSLVLVEAAFTDDSKTSDVDMRRRLTACAVVGSAPATPSPTAFMISFPHGNPPAFACLQDLMRYSGQQFGTWKLVAGNYDSPQWQLVAQADNAEPPGDVTAGMAAQQSFYHWLRSQFTTPSAPECQRLCSTSWLALPVLMAPGTPTPDAPVGRTALTKDTGARRFAFLQQTGINGNGLPILRNAFVGAGNNQALPPSALPLSIDRAGNCNLAGRQGFDSQLVLDFLNALYATNIASIESQTVARAVSDRMTLALKQNEQERLLTTEELNSVSSRLGRAASTGTALPMRQIAALRRSQNDLTRAVRAIKDKQTQYRRLRQRAQAILMNSEYSARVTFDICKDMSNVAADGLFYTDYPRGFWLRGGAIFVPKTAPCTENEVYSQHDTDPNSWASPNFNVRQRTTPSTKVSGWENADHPDMKLSDRAEARFIVFQSQQLSEGPVTPLVLPRSPFADSGAGNLSAVFYAPDAIVSGNDPHVGWSMLIRDLVNVRQEHATVPSASKWCAADQFAADSCPELAVEMQIRSPVPLLPELPVGSSLTNPGSHERVSQIPPMPASMF